MEVEKGRNMSQIGGEGWARFLACMRLTGGELISFSFRAERPKMVVIYINKEEDDEDDEDPLHEAIVAQRMRLSEEEVCNLWDIIPPRDDFVGVSFMTRLTSTMVDRHDMVCHTYCNKFYDTYMLYCYTYKCKLSGDMLSVESNDMLCGI